MRHRSVATAPLLLLLFFLYLIIRYVEIHSNIPTRKIFMHIAITRKKIMNTPHRWNIWTFYPWLTMFDGGKKISLLKNFWNLVNLIEIAIFQQNLDWNWTLQCRWTINHNFSPSLSRTVPLQSKFLIKNHQKNKHAFNMFSDVLCWFIADLWNFGFQQYVHSF